MKCAKCEMLNQIPETPCSHCGRMMPALKPVFISKTEAEDENAGQAENDASAEAQTEETGDAESQAESGQTEGSAEAEATPEAEEVVAEAGHVDNVGDETETETVT